jgi:hypothetical protein
MKLIAGYDPAVILFATLFCVGAVGCCALGVLVFLLYGLAAWPGLLFLLVAASFWVGCGSFLIVASDRQVDW